MMHNARSCKSLKMSTSSLLLLITPRSSMQLRWRRKKRCKYAPVQTSRRRRQRRASHRLLLRHARAAAVVERLGKARRRRVLLGRRRRARRVADVAATAWLSPIRAGLRRPRPGRAQEAVGVVPQRTGALRRGEADSRERVSSGRALSCPSQERGLPALRVFGENP